MTARILVTGATGAIGRHLLPQLVEAGIEVRASYLRDPLPLESVDWRQIDFMETQDFAELVVGCDAVVHLAGNTHDPDFMARLNVDTTTALLKAAQSLGVRYFGYLSSIAVYGAPWRRNIDEDCPVLDLAVPLEKQHHAEPEVLDYIRSKILAEEAIRAITKDIAADIYRASIVVDVEHVLEAGEWTAARKIANAYRRTHYLYVRDLAAAIMHLAKRGMASEVEIPREPVEVFNIIDEACGTHGDILNAAFAATQDSRYKLNAKLPVIADLFDDITKYKRIPRPPLGALHFSSARLLDTGFDFPHGIEAVLGQALAQHAERKETAPDQAVAVPDAAA